MARKQPQPGAFDPGDIPMSQGPVAVASQPVPQQQGEQPIYTERELVEHGELARLMTRKETTLHILHERATANKEIYLANTIAFIMADYKFIDLDPNATKEG